MIVFVLVAPMVVMVLGVVLVVVLLLGQLPVLVSALVPLWMVPLAQVAPLVFLLLLLLHLLNLLLASLLELIRTSGLFPVPQLALVLLPLEPIHPTWEVLETCPDWRGAPSC